MEPPQRAQSTGHGKPVVLPFKEEEEPQPQRGRTLTRNTDPAVVRRAVALLSHKQRRMQQEGQMRVHLGKFARSVQAQRSAARATTAPPPKRTYDDIEKEIEGAGDGATGPRKAVRFPEDTFFARHRVNTPDERRLMHQGRAVV